jgi:two-component system, OmpR family, sensor kinase
VGDDLGALVRRIEAFQRARKERMGEAPAHDAPRLPLGGETSKEPAPPALAAFLFTTDETGRVDWAEPAAAPLLVGALLAAPAPTGLDGFARAFARRRPITGAEGELAGAPALAGRWIVDAAPRFAPRSARFTGYVGRFRRPAAAPADTRALHAADRVRQLLHELRTPVTAIQGFAEVIQQQTVGPVPHEYRAIAAGIASEAARMLAGFAEIERLAMLEAGTQDLPEGTSDFVAVTRRQVAQLQTVLSPRVSRIEATIALAAATVPLAPEAAELIAWRFLGTLASAIAAGETMALSLTNGGEELRLSARLPAALAQSADVFAGDIHPAAGALGLSLLGAGFALRLARAEARAAGGDLVREDAATMVLTLPVGEARPVRAERPDRAVRHAPAPTSLAQSLPRR